MIATALLAASLAGASPPPPRIDPWFGEDKLKHLVTSFVTTTFAASAARVVGLPPRTSLYFGASAGVAAGLYKEIQDSRTTIFSGRDLLWDAGGIAAAGIVLEAAR